MITLVKDTIDNNDIDRPNRVVENLSKIDQRIQITLELERKCILIGWVQSIQYFVTQVHHLIF